MPCGATWETRSARRSSIIESNFGIAAGTAPPTLRREVSEERVAGETQFAIGLLTEK